MTGFVYFIGYGQSDWVKVGFATDVKIRLKSLKCSSPEPLTVEATVPATMVDERRLHSAIFGPRNREWFLRASVDGLIEMAREGRPIADIIDRAERTKQIIEAVTLMGRTALRVAECEEAAVDGRAEILEQMQALFGKQARERVAEMVA